MKPGRILIIEDDREMCDELAELLSLEGYAVNTAYDGIEGKRLVDGTDYSVVILDLKLPSLDGANLLRHIKQHHSCPVIVITGKPLGSELHRFLQPTEEGDRLARELADGFIQKPFRIESMLESIRKLAVQGGAPTPPMDPPSG